MTTNIVSDGAIADPSISAFADPKYVNPILTTLSADGSKAIFQSFGATDDSSGYFVEDLHTGVVVKIALDVDFPTFSADSSKVVFYSDYADGQATGIYNAYIKDIASGVTTAVSLDSGGHLASAEVWWVALSPDGSKVALNTTAANLTGDDGRYGGIMVRDLTTGSIQTISDPAHGGQADADAFYPVWSPDGTKLAFWSFADNVLDGQSPIGQIYVRDLVAGTTVMASAPMDGLPNSISFEPYAFSADSTKLIFMSGAQNLVRSQTKLPDDVYVKDLVTGQVTVIHDITADGTPDFGAFNYSLSPDGSKLAFTSSASNVVAGDTNGFEDAFVEDLSTGEVVRVSTGADGHEANGATTSIAFTPDGKSVIMQSDATNLVAGDTAPGGYFIKSLYAAPVNSPPVLLGAKAVLSKGMPGHDSVVTSTQLLQGFIDPDGDALSVVNVSAAHGHAVLASDGSVTITPDIGYGGAVTLSYTVTDGHGGTLAATLDMALTHTQFVANEARDTGAVELVSTRLPGVDGGANPDAGSAVFSPDGSQIAFSSQASNLVGGGDQPGDIFIRDLKTGALSHVATNLSGGYANGDSFNGRFSGDGGKIAFTSDASDLVAGDGNGATDVFVKDLSTGAITRVSTTASGADIGGGSYLEAISADGTKVIFDNDGTDLDPANTSHVNNLYLKDLTTGALTRLAMPPLGGEPDGDSAQVSFSPDGSKILFVSAADNLVAGDTNHAMDVFVEDLATGAITRVSPAQADDDSLFPTWSPDGSKIAFSSYADNIAGADWNFRKDLFVEDLATGALTRVSTSATGEEGNGSVLGNVQFSPDGTQILFTSSSSNLVAGDTNGTQDVFVKDLITGAITRVSTTASGAGAGGYSGVAGWSADGKWIAFTSASGDLGRDGDVGGTDVFLKAVTTPTDTGKVTGGANHGASGLLLFSDVDTTETHTVSVDAPSGVLGRLTATVSHDTTGTGTGGEITWNFTIDDTQLNTLHAGETRTEVFTVHLNDGWFPVDQAVTITLVGGATNSAPVSSGAHTVLAHGSQDHAYVVTAAQLLAGYSDPDGDALSVAGLAADHSTVVDNHDGTFTVTPVVGFSGALGLSYAISDGQGGMLAAGETISFDAFNHKQTGSSKTMDHLVGSRGDDSLNGAGGDDTLDGGAGNDTLQGGVGNDVMHGGAGNDTYYVDSALDVVSETTIDGIDDGGNDRVFSTVDYTLGQFVESLNLDGTGNISGIGNSLQNNIYGNGGDNFLSGMNGNDVLKGMGGNDTLSGGKGNDILEGGSGADTFVFLAASANGTDRITDFEHGIDRLSFNHQDYDSHSGFTLGGNAVGSGAQFLWNAANETLYYDHDGAGGDDAIALATFGAGVVVTLSDLHFT